MPTPRFVISCVQGLDLLLSRRTRRTRRGASCIFPFVVNVAIFVQMSTWRRLYMPAAGVSLCYFFVAVRDMLLLILPASLCFPSASRVLNCCCPHPMTASCLLWREGLSHMCFHACQSLFSTAPQSIRGICILISRAFNADIRVERDLNIHWQSLLLLLFLIIVMHDAFSLPFLS